MPSSRGRGWYCSAAARLQPPVAGRPARTAPGLVRPCLSRTRARRRGRARRSPAPRGREGPLSSNVDREHGRARVALGGPPASLAPPALGTCSHVPLIRRPPPCAPQIDRASEPELASKRGPRAAPCRPPRLPTRAAACGFEPASATPGRTGSAQGCGPPTGVRGGFARPRRQHSPEACSSSIHPPSWRGRPRFWERGVGPRARALRADLSFVCPHSAPRGRDEQRHERGWFCLPVWHAALCTLAVHTVAGCGCVLVGWLCVCCDLRLRPGGL